MQSAASEAYQRVRVDMRLDSGKHIRVGEDETRVGDQEIRYHTPEEEIA